MHVPLSVKTRANITSGTKAGNEMSTKMYYFNCCSFFVCFRPWLPVFWRMLVFCCLLQAQFKITFSTNSAVNWNLFGMHEAVFSLMHSESCFSLIDWFGKRLMIQGWLSAAWLIPYLHPSPSPHTLSSSAVDTLCPMVWAAPVWTGESSDPSWPVRHSFPVVPCTIIHLPCLI